MPSSERKPRPVPSPDQQVALRAALVEIMPGLLGKARLLARGLRPPPPSPHDLVNETARRLLARYVDEEVESASGLAHTTLTRIVCDIARKGRKFDGGFIESRIPDPAARESDPLLRRVVEALPAREQCVLNRIVLEGLAVPAAFKACAWESRAPYNEYDKILRKLHEQLAGTT